MTRLLASQTPSAGKHASALCTRACSAAAEMENIDSVIERLVAIKGSRPGTLVQLSDKEAFSLVAEAQRIVEDQPVMLEVQAPLQIVGDIHGQYPDLLRLFEFRGMPPDANYLFLGDYVDRGANGLECMFLLMALKIKHPEKVWLLRGNHECAAINRIYGFHDECKRNGGVESGWARGPRPPAVALFRWWWPRGRSPHVPEGSAAAGGLEGPRPPRLAGLPLLPGGATRSSCGRASRSFSTACRSPPSSMARSFASMVGCRPTSTRPPT